MNVLIACEESQRVCIEFLRKGHNAFSCDIIPCSGNRPDRHIMGDVLKIINGGKFKTMNGDKYEIKIWDLIIAHPPCTYLTVTGNRWFNVEKYGKKAQHRIYERERAIWFVEDIYYAKCKRIAIENPVGVLSTRLCKPTQIIQPYMFGDAFEKKTCLWLQNLEPLKPTNIVEPPSRIVFESGKTMAKWYNDARGDAKTRSKTFPGIARAMAEQWG